MSSLSKQEARAALAYLILEEPSHVVLEALCVDRRVFERVVLLLHANGILFRTTMDQVAKCVATAPHERALLRTGDSALARSLLTGCAGHLGADFYLRLVDWLQRRVLEVGPLLELDPMRLEGNDPTAAAAKVEENGIKLGQILLQLCAQLEEWFAPDDAFPYLRHLGGSVVQCIAARFPASTPPTLAPSLTLLHLTGPLFSIRAAHDPRTSRTLLLLAKTFQQVLNGLQFGNKEPHMQRLNPFVAQCQARLPALAARICRLGAVGDIPRPVVNTDALLDEFIDLAKRKEAQPELLKRIAAADVQRTVIPGIQGGRSETISVWLQLILSASAPGTPQGLPFWTLLRNCCPCFRRMLS